MNPVRLLGLLLGLYAITASAETVQLRKAGNAAVVSFEYITLDESTIMVKLAGKDAIISYKWDDLDLDWVKLNNPKIWAERELLLTSADGDKKMSKKDAELDPFAAEFVATDAKSLAKNLTIALRDGLKGIDIVKIDIVCKEFQLDESAFWTGYEDLKKASKVVSKNEVVVKTEAPVEEKVEKPGVKPRAPVVNGQKGKVAAAKAAATRTPENLEKDSAAKKDYDADAKPFSAIGYMRMLSETGLKGKTAWMILRRATEDRKNILAALKKYETIAAELAEKPDAKASRSEILVLKKAMSAAIESIEKVNRDNSTVESRLQSDCRSLLNQLPLR